ncbi:microsomal glutathione S-transferase [Rhodotorula taiwanensis]|uniref:Microsomal glutathione S-transferase n=1 Tax=Rhodotorula taiwanensis TaxID=741276 RepID=A0A2S5BC87_9BASI|nr:microsomal glutathione S-transferase [Rhodotorula taiwanensis]
MSLFSNIVGDYAYVTAVGTLGVYGLHVFATMRVSAARKAANIKYPAMLADNSEAERDSKANKFNCAQRAHYNTLENLPVFLITLFHSGLYYPRFAAVAGLVWVLGRFAYIDGYASGDPAKRQRGVFQYLGLLPMFGISVWKAVTSMPAVQELLK